jgi:hypothetical protein
MSALHVRSPIPLVLLILVLGTSVGCGSDDDPTAPPAPGEHVFVHHHGDSLRVELDDLPAVEVDDLQVVYLHHLVSDELIPPVISNDVSHEARILYAYQIEGDDGFSAHGNRGYPNNTWDHLQLGYIIKSTRRVIFPDEAIDLPGAYNVRETRHVRIWRKFDLELAAPDTTVFYELAGMPVVLRPNADGIDEDAIDLAEFVARLVTDERLDDPDDHVYHLTALDGFTTAVPVTWEQLQTGYWLLDSQRTRFGDPDLQSGQYRQRNLLRITVATP